MTLVDRTGSSSGIVRGSTKLSEVASVAIIRLQGMSGELVVEHAHAKFCSWRRWTLCASEGRLIGLRSATRFRDVNARQWTEVDPL
jgi:hypothetical protein